MNATEKRKFIRELISNVQKDILDKVPEMPKDWDGIELRQYIADRFSHNSSFSFRNPIGPRDRQRKRDYENEVLVRNL